MLIRPLILLLTFSAGCLFVEPCEAEEYQPDWESLAAYEAPEWYLDAKFGIWPHWGVYSVPAYRGDQAAEWYGRFMHCVEKGPDKRPKKNEPDVILNEFYDSRGLKTAQYHRDTYGPPEEYGYHEFVDQWKAERFDADEWADLAVRSGAKFFCMMAQHHDSFSLYDSDHTEWDSVDRGPKRDLCREVKQAVTKRGLKFGVSNHMAWNSSFFAYYHNNGYADAPGASRYRDLYSDGVVDDAYIDRWWKRTIEAVDKLEPDLYYFDWGWNTGRLADEGYHQKFAAYYYNRAIEQGKGKFGDPGVVFCTKDRDDPASSTVRDIERGRMGSIQRYVWQTDTSISVHSWGYSTEDEYFSTDVLVDQLVDIVSKNGVLMLNFGPKADGTIASEYRERLLGIGGWLEACGDAIYATRPFEIYGDKSRSDDSGNRVDVRYTRSKDKSTLYAIALEWPGESMTLPSLSRGRFDTEGVASVSLMGVPGQVEWRQDESGLTVQLPEKPSHEHAYPLVIQFEEKIPTLKKK